MIHKCLTPLESVKSFLEGSFWQGRFAVSFAQGKAAYQVIRIQDWGNTTRRKPGCEKTAFLGCPTGDSRPKPDSVCQIVLPTNVSLVDVSKCRISWNG